MVLEECGAAIAPIPLLSSVGLAAGALRASGLDSVLADIAGGVVATLAVHSPGRRLPGAPTTLQHGRLRGRAVAVPNLSRAELIVTLARSDDGVLVAVARCGDGVTPVPAAESTDPAQPVADVEIDAEPLATARVGVGSALTAPLVAAAADLVGVASAALHRVRRAREDTSSIRHADRRIPGDQTRAGRQLRQPGTRPQSHLRGGGAAGRSGHRTRGRLDRRGTGQGGGRRRGDQLCAYRGPGARRAGADLGARHSPLCPARLAGCRHAGRQSRALPRGGPPVRGRRGVSTVVDEFAAWLAEFLPNDYYENYRRVSLGPAAAARLPAGRLRGRMATADLAPRARR